MRNVHQRELPASAVSVGALLDQLGGPGDPLWPRPPWPSLRLDRGLEVGAVGGHGFVRYAVSAYTPGRRVEFTFTPGVGLLGWHALSAHPTGPDRCVLRHDMQGRFSGRMRVQWPLAVRWLHDACIEELLDNAERAVTGQVASPYRRSRWVRLLLRRSGPRVREVTVPPASRVHDSLPRVDFSDAHAVRLPAGVPQDAPYWADLLFRGPAALPVLDRAAEEVLCGADKRMLSYRAGVRVTTDGGGTTVTVSTVVQRHTRRGAAYFAVVRRAHPWIVRTLLARAAREHLDQRTPGRPAQQPLSLVVE